ncbi:MAG: hypothetical protein QXG65_02580 [Thermoplasmata archaeon]
MQQSPPSPSAAGNAGVPTMPIPPPTPPRRRGLWAAVGVVIVVVAVVLGLGVAGILPIPYLHPGGGGGGGTGATYAPSTFTPAMQNAKSAAQSYQSGTWTPYVALGVGNYASMTTTSATFNNVTSGCTITSVPNAPTSVTFESAAPVTAGTATWVFLGQVGSTFVIVVAGANTATVFATVSGACTQYFASGYVQGISSAVVNTPAVTAAVASGSQAFLSVYPTANAQYAILGNISVSGVFNLPSSWGVEFTTCSPLGTGTTGAMYNATVGAFSGQVSYQQNLSSTTCSTNIGPTGPLASGTPGAGLLAIVQAMDEAFGH